MAEVKSNERIKKVMKEKAKRVKQLKKQIKKYMRHGFSLSEICEILSVSKLQVLWLSLKEN